MENQIEIQEKEIVNPSNLDEFILKNVNWEQLTEIHNENKEAKTISIENVELNVKNLLLYIRSYSRVLIDYFTALRKKETDPFYMVIAGSTNITSDYDVTFIGKGSSLVCEQIIMSFYNSMGKNLADVADSNIYIYLQDLC